MNALNRDRSSDVEALMTACRNQVSGVLSASIEGCLASSVDKPLYFVFCFRPAKDPGCCATAASLDV
jgi:hypothetical protein